MTTRRMDPIKPTGWIIASTFTTPRGAHTSYWYGPDHGFGTTWGPLIERTGSGEKYSTIAVYPTRRAAESAFRTVRPLRASRGERAMRAADAMAMRPDDPNTARAGGAPR